MKFTCPDCGTTNDIDGRCPNCYPHGNAMRHEALPGPAVAGGRIALCSVCTEKVKKLDDGTWEHFGQDKQWEPMED